MDNQVLRATFNRNAETYNEMRPTYPSELFERIIQVTGLPNTAHLLEIGPGTGQATKDFAKRGYRITAVELGEDLAAVAKRELSCYEGVEILNSAFEHAILPENHFDLVYAATAFHWIPAEYKYSKPHKLLKSGGHIAIIHTNHVSDEVGDGFYHASQPIYQQFSTERVKSKKDTGKPLLLTKDIKPEPFDMKLFKQIHFETFPLVISYSTEEYLKLIGTYSPNLSMSEAEREAFFQELADLINKQFNSSVTKHYAMSLTVGTKVNK